MRFVFSRVFLLAWIVVFWAYHFLTYGKVEGKHERSMREKYKIRGKWAQFFGLTFPAWTAVIIFYFFRGGDWIYRFAFLDTTAVGIAGMALMCLSLLLYVLFTFSVGRSIRDSVVSGGEPGLVTTGIYRLARHPAYLAFLLMGLGTFLIVPNPVTLALLAYTFVVTNGHAADEERRLLALYGDGYERYSKAVGRFFPKNG